MSTITLKILNKNLKTIENKKCDILHEDTVKELKDRVYIKTGIPNYRQHLAYKDVTGEIQILGYSILKFNYTININIFSLADNLNLFEGLPIDISMFENKDNIKVLSLENNQTIPSRVKTIYVIDLNNFIDPIRDNLILLFKDVYSLELLYYSFIIKYWPHLTLSTFAAYIPDEESLYINYPYLITDLDALKVMYKRQKNIINKQKNIVINMIIFNIVVSIKEKYVKPKTYVQVRNIFDLLELNDIITYTILNIADNLDVVKLIKTWKSVSIDKKTILPKNSILINIKISNINSIKLIIKQNGEYYITVDRGVDLIQIKKTIIEHVNPIIDKINNVGYSIANTPFFKINMSNSYFSSMDISISYFISTSDNAIENTIDKFEEYGLFAVSKNSIYFNKGVYSIPLSNHFNQFEYLSDPELYDNYIKTVKSKKKINIMNRYSDIKIDLKNIKEIEFPNVIKYIKLFIYNLPKVNNTLTGSTLKKLKQQDPVLFDFKEVFKDTSTDVKKYSILCQKKKQPTIYTERPDKNAIEYKNITLDKPVFYKCNDKKYKFFNFIINKHPKGYCIPCCYKSHHQQGKKKNKIYKNCSKYNKYTTKQLRKQSYIKDYSESIRPGRIMKLPRILHTVMNESTGILKYQFYIYGIQQKLLNVDNVGIVFCLSNILNTNILDFIERTIKKIKLSGSWNILLNGTINNYFKSESTLINFIRDTFINGQATIFRLINELFISIAKIIWDMNVIVIEIFDTKNITIKYDKFNVKEKRNIILCKRKNKYNTLYFLNKNNYLVNEKIYNVMYRSSNELIKSLYNRVNISDTIKNIQTFVKYGFNKLYINSKNMCYAIKLDGCYIPIQETSYSNLSYPLSFDSLSESDLGNHTFVLEIIKILDQTVKFKLRYNNMIIGFISNGLYYLFKPIKESLIDSIDVPIVELKYNPIEIINTVNDYTFGKRVTIQDPRIKNIDKDLYSKFAYQLFLISFIDCISKKRNTLIRNKLKNTKDYKIIRQILKSHVKDYNLIVNIEKKKMHDFINNSIFSFDNKYKNTLKSMAIPDLKLEIAKIMKNKITVGLPRYYKFYNTYNTCNNMDTNTTYCDGNKLLLPPGKQKIYIDQLANDIKNPLKSEIILNPIFINYNSDKLKFIKRPNETIQILISK